MSTSRILFIFLVVTFAWNSIDGREFRLGMLSPRSHIRLGWENNAAAVTLAIERAENDSLLVGHSIKVIWRDDKCSALGGTGSAMLLKEIDDVDVFIGPPCSASTKPTGLLASFWNLPMFSQASTDPVLADKRTYKTLVRLGPPFNKLGKAFVEIFRYYNWSRVAMVTRRKTDERFVFCDYSSRSAEEQFRKANITLTDMIQISDDLGDDEIEDILLRMKQRARIIILCTENLRDRRRILVGASNKGMMNGEYVFFTPDQLPPANVKQPWITNGIIDKPLKEAYKFVFQITVSEMAGPKVETFRDEIPKKMAEPPWNFTEALEKNMRGSLYAPFLHDVVYLYLLVLNETLTEGHDHRNGSLIMAKCTGKTFEGVTGTVKVDSNADRDPDYWVWDMNPEDDQFRVSIEVKMTSQSIQKMLFLEKINWGTLGNSVPLDIPVCGFLNEKCLMEPNSKPWTIILLVLGCVFMVALTVSLLYFRHFQLENELKQMLWKVKYEDISFREHRRIDKRFGSISFSLSYSTSRSEVSIGGGEGQIYSPIAVYQGTVVAVQKIQTPVKHLSRRDQLELKAMRDLNHINVNVFAGMCIDDKYPCFLTVYCSKGSLQDIIQNDSIKLDWMFKYSLIRDIANGIQYIHDSPLKTHGNISSSNCVVDNRWVAKLTDFGMLHYRQPQFPTPYETCKGLFWTAPELLRFPSSQVTKAADIYSMGIVMFEVVHRCTPYDTEARSPQDIITRVAEGGETPSLMRPDLHGFKTESVVDGRMIHLIHSCWDENPMARPSISEVRDNLKTMNKGQKKNIVDNMLNMLEKYANDLEKIVDERTEQLMEEQRKTDLLLCRMLPPAVAERLKLGQIVKPELFDSVTIFFSDIVGFTGLCSESTPMEVVDLLNDLYTCFDRVISEHDVYKIETIGDAYMVVSGAPLRNGTKHVNAIADMSLDLLSATTTFQIRHRPGQRLQLRAGIHSGPCAAGVVGQIMPRYCLFGDTVNTASRMESTGEALKIHVSQAAFDVLELQGCYIMTTRGLLNIKGKGVQTTYWLLGKDGYKGPLPKTEV